MVKESIEVDVPLRQVYNQWTQFEEFPSFMEGVETVQQLDDQHCHWRTKVAGVQREFDTEIVDQLPDERISWRTVSGDVQQKGVVTFQQIDPAHTRVSLAMDFQPEGMAEKTGDALGMLDRRVKGDLKRFKGFIEDRGRETGGWRGRITPAESAAMTDPAGPGGTTAMGEARMTDEGAPPRQGYADKPPTPGAGRTPVDPDDMRHG